MILEETYISVDVETAGPIPGKYALLSIGACLVENPSTTIYMELQPDKQEVNAEAMAIHGLSFKNLEISGIPPAKAMQIFADWINKVTHEGQKPIFVALNAPFDWMFINDYFHHYLGNNPFGHSALDIKAYFMGMAGVYWGRTTFKNISDYFSVGGHRTHNALADALDQAKIFRKMLEQTAKHRG